MLTIDGLQYFNVDAVPLVNVHENTVIVDHDVICIPLQYVSRPCGVPEKLCYHGTDNTLHMFTPEVRIIVMTRVHRSSSLCILFVLATGQLYSVYSKPQGY